MAEVLDLDEFIDRLPKQSAREAFEEIQAAGRAALSAPPVEPSIIPSPEFPYGFGHPLSGTARFHCHLRCGWWWDEQPDREPLGPIVFKAAEGLTGLSAALTANAQRRGDAMRARIEDEIREHFKTAHAGREIPWAGAS